MESFVARISSLESRIERLEMLPLFNESSVDRVRRHLKSKRIFNAAQLQVAGNYYELTLKERAKILHARNESQLCKSIIFENSAYECDESIPDNITADPTNSRYYLVIVQYEGTYDPLRNKL